MGRQLSVAEDWNPAAQARIEAARRASDRALMRLMALKERLGPL